jgi:hypothetical protein
LRRLVAEQVFIQRGVRASHTQRQTVGELSSLQRSGVLLPLILGDIHFVDGERDRSR